MMVFAGGEDPTISEKLFKSSKKKDKKKDKGRKEAEKHYFDVFGKKGEEMNQAITEETGATEDEVNGIMSMFLPTFEEAIAEEDIEDPGALQKMFHREAEDAKKASPSFEKMAMKIVF